jgi:N6-L-threonylcarbamoyladenine synthase
LRILGIETSCDETAAAVVEADGPRDFDPAMAAPGRVLGQAVLSQIGDHRPFGGVVPEIAARSHLAHLDHLIRSAMKEAGLGFHDLDGIAATAGPGLIGGVAFPFLLLLVSGGHCQLLIVEGVGRYRRLGTTVDDAAGEAFDKVAKMLGLGYPGGPAVERAAVTGDATRFAFPRPMKGKPGCDFSFSGLKTAVRLAVEALPALTPQDAADLAASFQAALVDATIDRVRRAIEMFRRDTQGTTLVVSGGVAANSALRAGLAVLAEKSGLKFVAPPLALCTDNAVMIAWAGVERLRLGLTDPLDAKARPRWPLDPSAPTRTGAGVKA